MLVEMAMMIINNAKLKFRVDKDRIGKQGIEINSIKQFCFNKIIQ